MSRVPFGPIKLKGDAALFVLLAIAPLEPCVATMIEEVSSSLDKLYHLEQVAENLGELGHIDSLAHAIAGYTIARYGSDEDRAKIVEHFKGWFWESEIFKK
jgi:hypothetical protein